MFWLTGGGWSVHDSQLLIDNHLDERSTVFLHTKLEKDVSSNVFSAPNLGPNLIILFFPLKVLSLGILWGYQNLCFHFLQWDSFQFSCFMGKSLKGGPKTQKNPHQQKSKTHTTNQVKPNKYLHLSRLNLYTHTPFCLCEATDGALICMSVTLVQNSKTLWICWKDYSKLLPIFPSNIQAQTVSCTCSPTCWDFPGAGPWQPQSLPCFSGIAPAAVS